MSTHIRELERARTHRDETATSLAKSHGRLVRWLMVALLLVVCLLAFGYAGISTYIATKLIYEPQMPLAGTPSKYGLVFHYVTFPAREDGIQLKGWFIPGVLPDGRLTVDRTIILIHGMRQNRTERLDLSAIFARRGYAVLAFDMRGSGESPAAPLSFGLYEQRDILGAVDFLRSGPLPDAALGRPRVIAGYGVSMGGTALILAAAKEPAIRAVVTDSATADYLPVLKRDIPKRSGLPAAFTPGTLAVVAVLYGVKMYGAGYYGERPVDVISRIAPRPIFLIHGTADTEIPPSHLDQLYASATSAPNAHVQKLLVPGAKHAMAFYVLGEPYVTRVVAFYADTLGPDRSAAH